MNYRTIIKQTIFVMITLILVGCLPVATRPAPTLPENPFEAKTATPAEKNPFEQPGSGAGERIGGYSAGPVGIDPRNGDTLTYIGDPIQVSFFLQGTGSDTEVGLMLFLDGVVQPHQVVKTSQQEDPPELGQDVIISKHRVSSNGRTEFTVSFTPISGTIGEELGLSRLFLFEPSFTPETENQTFGIYQDGTPQLLAPVIMKTDAPQKGDDYKVDVETTPIPQSEKIASQLNPSGRISQPKFLFYSGENKWNNKSITQNGRIEMTASVYGGIEADYRVTVFVNHQPVSVAGHQDFLIQTHYDQISTYRFILDVHDYDRLNSLYAIFIPVGQSYKDSDIHGTKIPSILLINDLAGAVSPSSEPIQTANSTATVIPSAVGKDLSPLLTGNEITSRYGLPAIHLVAEDQLMVWFDSAALFDLSSETLIYKKEVTSSPSDQKVDFSGNVVGVFAKDAGCMDCSIRLDRFDLSLNLIDTVDLSQIFDSRVDVLRPTQCALSQSGEKIVCAKDETSQVLLYDLRSKTQSMAFDFSKSSLPEFRGVDAIAFAGNDRYLAFTATDSSGYGFGIIDLQNNRLANFTPWDAVADDIQITGNAVYFHEQLKSPTIPVSGKIFKLDLDTLEKQEIQLAEDEESKYVSISSTGKYIVTVKDTAEPGADYTAGSIRVYDSQTMALIRQIDLERGFPRLAIDEANRFLIAYYSVGSNMKMFQYAF